MQQRYRLWSLLELHKLNAQDFALISETYRVLLLQLDNAIIETIPAFPNANQYGKNTVALEHIRGIFQGYLKTIEDKCYEIGANCSGDSANRAFEFLNGDITFGDISSIVQHANTVFFDEMARWKAFILDPSDSILFDQTAGEYFGGMVESRFTNSLPEIEEAMKCLALERGTACVFHLMRVLESASDAIYKSLPSHTPDPKDGNDPGWGLNYRRLDRFIKTSSMGHPPDWATKEPFYNNARHDLNAAYRAVRCPTAHDMLRTYAPPHSRAIMEVMRMLLVGLATHIDENGNWYP